MKLKFIPFLLVGLLAANAAQAQTPVSEQRDAAKVEHFLKSHPEHAAAFTREGAKEGMMVCTSKEALSAFEYAQNNEARAASLVELGSLDSSVQPLNAPQQLRTEPAVNRKDPDQVAKRITELEALRKQDPENAGKYTRELKQLRDEQASPR